MPKAYIKQCSKSNNYSISKNTCLLAKTVIRWSKRLLISENV